MGWSTPPSAGGSGFTGNYGSGTITADTPITFTQTWNNAAVSFTAFKISITNTASTGTYKYIDCQVGGVTKILMYGDATGYNTLDSQNGNGLNLAVNGTIRGSYGATGWDWANFQLVNVKYIKVNPVTVASLVSAATAGAGSRCHVTDATAPTWGATVAGGGAVSCPVFSDGTNWKVG